jgi:hypothetical protein
MQVSAAFVIAWAVCALVGWAIGNSKGRGTAGFFLGLLLGVIGLIIIAVMRPTPEYAAQRANTTARAPVIAPPPPPSSPPLRACPWCAEQIQPAAKICRYCQREVEPIDVASTDVTSRDVASRDVASSDVASTEVASTDAGGMEAVRSQYPAFFSEASAALSEVSGAPPTDPVAWVRRVCELRMAGESLTKATTRATNDLTPPAAH